MAKEDHWVNKATVLPESRLSEVVIGFEVQGDEPDKPSKVFRMNTSVANKLFEALGIVLYPK